MSPLPVAILFDLDDTLVSFSAGPRDFWQEAWTAQGGEATGLTAGEWSAALARQASVYWGDEERSIRGRLDLFRARRELTELTRKAVGLADAELTARVADDYTVRKEQAVEPFEGAVEALEEFRRRGVLMGLVTNGGSDFQRAKLRRHDLTQYFAAIVVEGELGVGKPDPRGFVDALKTLGVRAEEAWMVGDNLSADIAGAQGVGIHAIWNDHAKAGLPEQSPVRPDRTIHHVSELL